MNYPHCKIEHPDLQAQTAAFGAFLLARKPPCIDSVPYSNFLQTKIIVIIFNTLL